MKMTIVEANRLAKQFSEEIKRLEAEEANVRVYAHSEGEQPVIQKYDFRGTQDRITALQGKVTKIRHRVNSFNITSKINGMDMTVDEALIRISFLSNKLKKLADMKGIQAVYRKSTYSSVEIVHRNFDLDEVIAEWESVLKELNQLRAALDLTNLTETIEVDIAD